MRPSRICWMGLHSTNGKPMVLGIIFSIPQGEVLRVYAILDCRRNPAWIRERLS